MVVDPIGAAVTPLAASASQAASRVNFENMVGHYATQLNSSLVHSSQLVKSLDSGANIPVHNVTIAMSEATLQLQLAVAVRNRVVQAYQEFMRMQV